MSEQQLPKVDFSAQIEELTKSLTPPAETEQRPTAPITIGPGPGEQVGPAPGTQPTGVDALETTLVGAGSMIGSLAAERAQQMGSRVPRFGYGRIGDAPRAIAAITGGVIGTAEGFFASEAVKTIAQKFGIDLGDPRKAGPEKFRAAFDLMSQDLLFGGGSHLFGPLISMGRGGLARLMLNHPNRKFGNLLAERTGINLSIADLSESQLVKFFPRVLGRLPFIAPAFRRRFAEIHGEVISAKERMFLRLGPTLNMSELSKNMDRVMDKRFRVIREGLGDAYAKIQADAIANGATIGRRNLTDAMGRARGVVYGGGKNRATEDILLDLDRVLVNMVDDLPENFTFKQLDELQGKLELLAKTFSKDKTKKAHFQLVQEFSKQMENVKYATNDPEIAMRFAQADADMGRVLFEVFDNPTAKILGGKKGIRPGRFTRKARKAPVKEAKNADTTVRVLQSAGVFKNPTSVKQLRAIIGDAQMQQTMRNRLDEAWTAAEVAGKKSADGVMPSGGGINMKVFRGRLGLDDVNSSDYAATVEMLKGTGVDIDDIKLLADGAESALSTVPPDVNSYIARTVALHGGLSGLRKVLTPFTATAAAGTAAVSASVPAGVAVLLIGRLGGRLLTHPGAIRHLGKALDPTLSNIARKAAITAVVRFAEKKGLIDARIDPEQNGRSLLLLNARDMDLEMQKQGFTDPTFGPPAGQEIERPFPVKVGKPNFERAFPELFRDVRGMRKALFPGR